MGESFFVQLPHPGGEHGPDLPGGSLKSWEAGENEHRRKFMSCPGVWRERVNGPESIGELRFWGEWEADSFVESIAAPRVEGGPRWLHRPFFAEPSHEDERVPQNTDPFVFGDRFLYTFCRQPRNRHLRSLGRGSLILFGSRKAGGFVLDTVLVVGEFVDHDRETFRDVAYARTDPVFHATTLEPMYRWNRTRGGRLYFGATPDAPVDGMFSFVPCMPASTQAGFDRPEIVLPGLIEPGLAMQARTLPKHRGELQATWADVVEQVLACGLYLGTRIELPGSTAGGEGS